MENKKEEFISIDEARETSRKKTSSDVNDLRDRLKTTEKEVENKLNKVDKKIDDSKIKVIETLGIFVALFTFISIEFQAFRTISDLTAIAGLTLIMLGALIFFIIILDIIINLPLNLNRYKKIPGLLDNTLKSAINFTGYEEKIDFKFFNLKTWTPELIFRGIIIFFCFSCIVCGIILISGTKINEEDKSLYQFEDDLQKNTIEYKKNW